MAESHRDEIAKLEALYAGNPGGRVFVHLAEAYRKAGEHERARRILDEGLARHEDSASGYVVLGRVLADMQIVEEAETAFRRVLELDGGNLVALRWLGDLARQAGRSEEAAAHYRELLTRNPSNEEVRDLVEIVTREAAASPPAPALAIDADLPDVEVVAADVEAPVWETVVHEAAEDAHAQFAEVSQEHVAGEAGDTLEVGEADTAAVAESGEPTAEAPTGAVLTDEVLTDELLTDEVPTDDEPMFAPFVEPPAEEPVDVRAEVMDVGAMELETLDADTLDIEVLDIEALGVEGADGDDMGDETMDPDAIALGVMDLDTMAGDALEDSAGYLSDDEVQPLDISLVDATLDVSGLAAEDEEGAAAGDIAVPLDLTDLAEVAGDESEEDYAGDEFLADFISALPESAEEDTFGELDVALDAATPFGLAGDDEDSTEPEVSRPTVYAPQEYPEELIEFMDVVEEAAEAEVGAGESIESDEVPEEISDGALTGLAGAVAPAAEADESDWAARGEPAFEPASDTPGPAADEFLEQGLDDSAPVTETMALLYRSQGFHDRAAAVYRALLRQRPADERLAARLAEAENAARGAPAPAAPAEDEAGEVWLRGVGAIWGADAAETADATEAAEVTPYAWAGDADDGDRGEPIASFLQDLVSWKQGQSRWLEMTVLEMETVDRAEPAASQDWYDAPSSDTERDEDAGPLDPWAEAAADVVADWLPLDALDDEPDGAGAVAEAEREPEAAAEPMTTEAAEPMTTGVAEPWTPLDLDAAAEEAVPANVAQPSAEPDQKDDGAEDEDLEMFRSWLQSLKK